MKTSVGKSVSNDKLSLLLVDDEKSDLLFLSKIFAPDYRVLTVKDGKSAMRILAQQHLDLVILDIMMPDEDGFDIYRKIREQKTSRNIPVIFLTGRGDLASEKRGLNSGVFDYIRKPVDPEIIRARVLRALDSAGRKALVSAPVTIDQLTGVANREYFLDRLELEWRRGARYAQGVSLLRFDIAKFRAYNEQYGFMQGDLMLAAIGKVMAQNARRAGDLAARFDEDAFAVLLPDTTIDAALAIAEIIRDEVAKLRLIDGAAPLTIIYAAVTARPRLDLQSAVFLQAAEKELARIKTLPPGVRGKNYTIF